ncbi:MAG: hypothetical protein A2504_07725 [Bdellovibrionales bacterium RIFOXYD12_FULL_39_22]|nr:MAG: hypothetical protein A2385_11050 [Bdellovibrionales bacterium RIFOXYB1_FULL_39_21]OFZ41281.1 MAG: hypothetical protein A2485_00635 [Bdellovibrionales bacterium RIFOXYC12_FULL_39_17]OFZ45069.1 MAG: hypothetical protein A2404_11345 [Bdellovibrionales bacterium RIFOXYC1_FULL_39_130]OFZ70779.1 MAG: hypothetical protein A2451_02395 [Bdellovibrionales bacterium RIFOXYC2_FULL_39_8]OFZ74453.1 MAG: hypothetical protein A2560_11380 [Bdellovibrionales bacterium RIFOXYD1_FULL_39_84]OFZ92465.1 MAG:
MINIKQKTELGFSLIEVLVAITLLSFLMLYVYNLVDTSSQTKIDVSDQDQNFLQIEAALNRFKLDFDLIYSPIYFSAFKSKRQSGQEESGDDLASGAFAGTGEKFPFLSGTEQLVPEILNPANSSIVFFTANNQRKFINSKQSNYAWVQYKLVDSAEGENKNKEAPLELLRYYNSINPYTRDFDWEATKPHVILKNIKKFEFLFWDSTRKEFQSSLKELNKADKFAMQAIKVKLEWAYNGEEVVIERIYRNLWPFFDPLQDKNSAEQIQANTETESP